MKTAREIFESGKFDLLSEKHIVQIVKNLYEKGLADAFFIGMGWPEGIHYCYDQNYVKLTIAPSILNRTSPKWPSYWFAIRFMD